YRQLSQHARIAERVFAGRDPKPEILLAENGDLIQLDADGARITGKAPIGRVLIDGTRTGEVGDQVLRDRRHLAEDGLVVPVVAINKQTGALEGTPEMVTRGFVTRDGETLRADGARLLADVVGWNYFWCRSFEAAGTKALGVTLFAGSLGALLSLVFGTIDLSGKAFRAGGYAGEWLARILAEYFNRTGSVIVVLTSILLAV